MGLLNDEMFREIDERNAWRDITHPRQNVFGDWPYPSSPKPRPLTDEERVARVRKALDAKVPPETYPCNDPRCEQARRDYTDWVLVRLGSCFASWLSYESLVYQQAGELFPPWVGPDGTIYANPMDQRLRERAQKAIATMPAEVDRCAWLREQLAQEKEESWKWL